MKNKSINQALLLLGLNLLLTACTQTPTAKKIGPEDFHSRLQNLQNFQLIDVRTVEEYYSGHLSSASNIDIHKDMFSESVNKLDTSEPVFVYCKSGNRSEKASKILKTLGFKEVYDLTGGISAWQSNGYGVVSKSQNTHDYQHYSNKARELR